MLSSNPEFLVFPYRFHFTVLDELQIPASQGGNIIRGALGTILRRIACKPTCHGASHSDECIYSRLFAPKLGKGPSGLRDPPRPFVLRASDFEGSLVEAGQAFYFDVHLFAGGNRSIEYFASAFAELAHEGLGPARARVELVRIDALDSGRRPYLTVYRDGEFIVRYPPPVIIPLLPGSEAVDKLELRFLTSTELKHEGKLTRVPEFGIIFSRLRDRITSLRSLYGEIATEIDFAGIGERAKVVHLVECSLDWHEAERRSSRTGQTHPIGGFTGNAIYEGDLAEFVPWLRAGYWTGVGRQTVWGKGTIDVFPAPVR
jgi:hypothetical protein